MDKVPPPRFSQTPKYSYYLLFGFGFPYKYDEVPRPFVIPDVTSLNSNAARSLARNRNMNTISASVRARPNSQVPVSPSIRDFRRLNSSSALLVGNLLLADLFLMAIPLINIPQISPTIAKSLLPLITWKTYAAYPPVSRALLILSRHVR